MFSLFLHGLSPSPSSSAISSWSISESEYIFCSVHIDTHGSGNGIENIVGLSVSENWSSSLENISVNITQDTNISDNWGIRWSIVVLVVFFRAQVPSYNPGITDLLVFTVQWPRGNGGQEEQKQHCKAASRYLLGLLKNTQIVFSQMNIQPCIHCRETKKNAMTIM